MGTQNPVHSEEYSDKTLLEGALGEETSLPTLKNRSQLSLKDLSLPFHVLHCMLASCRRNEGEQVSRPWEERLELFHLKALFSVFTRPLELWLFLLEGREEQIL